MGRGSHSVKLSVVAVAGVALALLGASLVTTGVTTASAAARTAKVLYVGTYKGIITPAAQTFSTIQSAVDAARKGDTILIAPGDYH